MSQLSLITCHFADESFEAINYIPYILAYKPTIFGRILMIKLLGVSLYACHATQPYFNNQSQYSMDH